MLATTFKWSRTALAAMLLGGATTACSPQSAPDSEKADASQTEQAKAEAPKTESAQIESHQEESHQKKLSRTELQKKLPLAEAAFKAAPNNDNARRDYADTLFKLGNIWQANEIITPLATPSSSHVGDVELAAKAALFTGDYPRAEALFKRLQAITEPGSKTHDEAIKGLVLTYYQTNQFAQSKTLEPITLSPINKGDETGEAGVGTLLAFMQRFEGQPYQLAWDNDEKVAHLPMINDINQPGALPLVTLEINDKPVKFILDTGGDRLYIDEAVAEHLGIRHISKRKAKYAYTKGEMVDEPLGVADTVNLNGVTLKNVPVVVAKWKAIVGDESDGVVTTQLLKQFLSTVDYQNKRITLRERSEAGHRQLAESFGNEQPYQLPFFMATTHLMFAKGSLNGQEGMNLFMDSGLAASMPLVVLDETVDFLGLEKNAIEGTDYYWSPIESFGLGNMVSGASQALGNIFVEKNPYSSYGFVFDALLSHQYLKDLGSWTIDFDNMVYYFPTAATNSESPEEVPTTATSADNSVKNPEHYIGSYEVAPGVALEISSQEGVLFLQAPGQQKIALQAEADGSFSIPLAGATVIFEKDESGQAVSLTLDQAGHKTIGIRK